MPDIELRFHKDMLTLTAPIDAALSRQGIVAARDRQYLNLMEPDVVTDVLRLELMAGAQCLVTPTEDITRARLSHVNMDADAPRLAKAVLDIAADLKPQHVLVEIGPCGLPLDPSSKASLNENRGQYADAARAFDDGPFDAFFLNGFSNVSDLKCALMGVAQASGKPVFASVTLGKPREGAAEGTARPAAHAARAARSSSESIEDVLGGTYSLSTSGFALVDEEPAPPSPSAYLHPMDPEKWPEALDVMADLGAAVVGFETEEPIDVAVEYARAAVERVGLPVLAQLRVEGAPDGAAAKGLVPLADIKDYTPDTMTGAAAKLYAAGVQFVRATGNATPAFTGAIAATLMGLDVRCR